MSTASSPVSSSLTASPPSRLALAAGALIILGSLLVGMVFDASNGLLMLVGGLLGMVLYHAAFGFTAAWRVFITERKGRGLRVIAVYGGVGYEEQEAAFDGGHEVVVGTPGRLLDHVNKGNLDLSGVTELLDPEPVESEL